MKKFFIWLEKLKLKRMKVYIRKNVKFKNTVFEGKNKIGKETEFQNSYLGIGSYIGKFCVLNDTKIGKYSSIGFYVRVYTGNHPFHIVTTHPAFYSNSLKKMGLFFQDIPELNSEKNKIDKYSLEIGNDVWIGSGVTIVTGGGR